MTLDREDIEAIADAVALRLGGARQLKAASAVSDADVSGALLALDLSNRPLSERKAYFDNLARQQKQGLGKRRARNV